MGRRAVIVAVIIAAIAGAAYYFYFYLPPRRGTDEEQVLRLIVEVEKAVEQGSVSGVMEHISEDYSDAHGLTYRMVQRLVVMGARDSRGVILSVQVPEVQVSGETASFVAEVDYGFQGQTEPVHLTVSADLVREGGRWKVISAEGWQGAEAAYY